MRRLPSLAVLSALVPAALMLPTFSRATAPTPAAVAPTVHSIALEPPLEAGEGMKAMAAGQRRPLVLVPERATPPFGAVAVNWAHDPAVTGVKAEIRLRSGGRWGDWETLESDDAMPDAGSLDDGPTRRDSTELLWVGRADGVQVRVDRPSGRLPRDLQLTLIDPGTSPHDVALDQARAPGQAHAGTNRPAIVSRAEWGADESLRDLNGERCRTPAYGSTVKVGFVHHTVSRNDYAPSESAAILRSIYAFHVRSNGWCDIGYNFLVDRYGRVFEGRFGGVDEAVIGAHTYGFNTNTFSVSMIGDFTSVSPPTEMLDATAQVLAWKLMSNGRDLIGKQTLVTGDADKYAAGQPVDFDVISAHRDANATECPGSAAYALMADIRWRALAHAGLVNSPIRLRWEALGGPASWLGAPLTPELEVPGGRAAYFFGGALFWSPSTDVREAHGAILDHYRALGATTSALGFPVADEVAVPGGRMSEFQFGSLYWSTASGAWEVHGEIRQHWLQLGGPTASTGYPVSDEYPLSGGAASNFQNGRIYWSDATAAHEVHGDILERYLELGGPDSILGLPVSDEYDTHDARRSDFQHGALLWLPTTRTVLLVPGGVPSAPS